MSELSETDVLEDVFPGLELFADECPCGCGDPTGLVGGETLPMVRPVPVADLADQVSRTPLVRRVIALASWLGAGRPAGEEAGLGAADAASAVRELGLAARVLPGADGATSGPATSDPASVVRPLWDAACEPGVITVSEGMARPGAALTLLQDPGSPPEDVIETWAALLAGYLMTAVAEPDVAPDPAMDGDVRRSSLMAGLPMTLYALAHEPVTVGELSTALLPPDGYEDDPEGFTALFDLPPLTDRVAEALEHWAVAGVVTVATDDEDGGLHDPYGDLELLLGDPDAARTPRGREIALSLQPTIEAGRRGPLVKLTTLGVYGLARLLAAHGFLVPELGDCRDLSPAGLLDRLVFYPDDDLISEAAAWVAARGEEGEAALREAAAIAAKGESGLGPWHRTVLPKLLAGAGSQVEPLLGALEAEPMLAVPVAEARRLLGTGPELTTAQKAWGSIDVVSMALVDEEVLAPAVADADLPSLLAELLEEPGGEDALLGIDHPQARDVLWAAARHLGDAGLARRLRDLLGADDHRGARAARGVRRGRPGKTGKKRGSRRRR